MIKGIYEIINEIDEKSESGQKLVNVKCIKCNSYYTLVYKNIKSNKNKKGCTNCANSNRIFKNKQTEEEKLLYRKYSAIKRRCYNKTNPDYINYGGRGITICNEWLDNHINFIKWGLNNGFKLGLEIDRENNDGNYEPSNCRWVTKKINNRNKRQVKLNERLVREIRYGQYKNLSRKAIAKIIGCSKSTIDNLVNFKTWKEI